MTEIERKALALVSEVAGWLTEDIEDFTPNELLSTLCRAIERHEAFRQEVSDVCSDVRLNDGLHKLDRFIIAKPDPLVEALQAVDEFANPTWVERIAPQLRAALAARGLKIVWGEG